MGTNTRQGLALLAAALAFGIAAETLALTVPGRLNVALGLGTFLLTGGFLVHRGLLPVPAGVGPVAPPFALLVVALIWRDSPTLFALNLLGLLLIGALASPVVRSVGWQAAGITDYPRATARLAAAAAGGAAPLLFSDIEWRTLPDRGPLRQIRGALVGLAAASPVAALFGGLLMDADPVFARLLGNVFDPELDLLGMRAMGALAWAWLGAGTLRWFILGRGGSRSPSPGWSGGRLGLAEVGTALLVLDLLFLAFVLVQVRYLFGGEDVVRAVAGLSYAEYARQGFFQLVAVAGLSLPVLLFSDWVLGRHDRAAIRRFRLLAALMLVLLNVMLASALWRMRLYTAEYGLTELRFYTTAFMGWLVLVLAWFAATVLRGRRRRFGAGAVVAALLVLAALNLINPDGLIARSDLLRPPSPVRAVDAWYVSRLSADAVPTIRRLLPALAPADRRAVERALAERWGPEIERGGRWNISFAGVVRQADGCGDCLGSAAR